MNNVLELAISPLGSLLWKWTVLLALGWTLYGCLRRRHPRWRLILWRSLLIFSLTLPLLPILSLPAFTIRIPQVADVAPVDAKNMALILKSRSAAARTISPESPHRAASTGASVTPMRVVPDTTPSKPFPWKIILSSVWALGCVFGVLRLIGFHLQLARLRRQSQEPPVALAELATAIQTRLNVRQGVRLRISDATRSPFVCGLGRPTIMLPQQLAESISTDQIAALLAHETAHVRGHDLLWSAGWRWLQIIGWFHPLVWRISAAHNFACEQEADRVASGRNEERDTYSQMLAQLALRVLALPDVETRLTLNGTAQIVRRLQQLKSMDVWSARHTVIGLGMVAMLFLIAVGCKFSGSNPATEHSSPGEFKQVMVQVQDEAGNPIEGAHVNPFGFRVKGIHGADAYGWPTNVFGPKESAVTGPDGKAFLKYPVMGIPEEKEYTGALIFSVTDPQYSTVTIQDYRVDRTNAPIRMIQGITLDVSGYYGADRRPVTDLVPNLADDGVRPGDWQKEADGTLICHKLSPGGHVIQLMGRMPSGEIVYSDAALVTAERGKTSRLALEMKPGIRLEGQLDDRAPRPIKDGRVMIDVRPPQYPATNVIEDFYDLDKKYGRLSYWHSYRPINADGTFVFESVPPGEVDVVVLGDGFATQSEGKLFNRFNGVLGKGPRMPVPQSFPLTAPVTAITVKTEPTATLEFKAVTRGGQPIKDVRLGLWPSAFRMPGMYGWVTNSSELPYVKIPQLPDLAFHGRTDSDGMLFIRNIPAEAGGPLSIGSERYQVPLQEPKGWRDRFIRTRFEPGVTNKLEIVLEPKGTDYIGR